MPSLSTSPTYLAAGKQARITVTLTESGTNFVRIWCTIAPTGSELALKLAAGSLNRVQVYEGDGGAKTWTTTFDKGGKYTFVAQEYTRGSAWGGGYQGDDQGGLSETKVGSEASLTLHLGQAMEQKIGVGADTGTLVLWVWDGTIRATTIAEYGEKTPAIVRRSTARASTAADDANTAAALSALVGVGWSTAVGDITTLVAQIRTKQNAHNSLTSGSVHAGADTINVILSENAGAPTPTELATFVNDAIQKFRRHRLNDAELGTGSASYHSPSGNDTGDFTNMPLFRSVGSLEEAYAGLADLWRAHEAHRVSTTAHGAADNTNSLPSISGTILNVHRYFLASLAALAPTSAPAESDAAVNLAAKAGFKKRA